jgi:hypothetical protein
VKKLPPQYQSPKPLPSQISALCLIRYNFVKSGNPEKGKKQKTKRKVSRKMFNV